MALLTFKVLFVAVGFVLVVFWLCFVVGFVLVLFWWLLVLFWLSFVVVVFCGCNFVLFFVGVDE